MIHLLYKELVFQKIVGRDNWKGPYHHTSYGVLITLECGHQKQYAHGNAPKHEALCHVCTLNRAAGANLSRQNLIRRVK
jgi:hypothetical protein